MIANSSSQINGNGILDFTDLLRDVVSSMGDFTIPPAMLLYGILLEHINIDLLICVSGLLIVLGYFHSRSAI